MSVELPKIYNPAEYEDGVYEKWEKSGFFNPDNLGLPKTAKPYTIVLPPPNITDKLHLGHSAMLAIEDLLIRYHRMKGERALWIPGTDHAPIATQYVVEKKLWQEEKKTRHDLGREEFLKRVWQFLRETQATILRQTRKMGASLDWSRQAFTLDEPRAKAVKKLFVDMYDEGVIYRGVRVVNWCPRCQSTLADDEVEYKEEKGKLYWLKYGPFVLATSRPETKLGDTAVAVYPGDKRYEKMVGKKYKIPGVLGEFEIIVVADRAVDPKFGSGAIKVTPAHDFTDYQIAQRHNLAMKQVINEQGRMMANTGKYAGLTTKEAREAILADMEKMGLLDHIEDGYLHNIALCYRCGTQIEPIPSKQWFVDVDKKLKRLGGKSLKEKAIAAAADGKIEFIPERFKKRYLDWMNNLHDWCVSRQLWFGHRIPVWYKKAEGRSKKLEDKDQEIYVGAEAPQNSNFVFLHGFYRTRDVKDPLNWLNKQLPNQENFWQILPNPDKPNRDEQEKFVLASAKIDKNSIIVTHSLGSALALKIIQSSNLKIKKLVMLAPSLRTKKKELIEYKNYKYDFKKIKENVGEIVIFQAGEDHAVTAEEVAEIAVALDAKIIKVENSASHFNSDECQDILNELKKDFWVQDEDTLDTWFSSGTWTFSTLGWPDNYVKGKKSGDLARFHPTQVLETGYEIITLWVSRMIIMSFYALNEIPFEKVYLHGMILDKNGKKMSKSKGNGIDPLEMIDKFGTDAVRLSLLMGNTPGNDAKYSEDKIASFRNFTNKLWNVARYIITNHESRIMNNELNLKNLTISDRWILGKMEELIKKVTEDLESYSFSQAGESLREFTWDDLADWYLEASKFEKNEEKSRILNYVLENLLKLWHPFMPFVTETIWQKMGHKTFLMVEKWPKSDSIASLQNDKIEFEVVKEIIVAIRNARAENKVEPGQKVKAVIYAGKRKKLITEQAHLIKSLRTGISELEIKTKGEKIAGAIYAAVGDIEIYLVGAVDKAKEKARLEKEIVNLEKVIKAAEARLANKEFVSNAPAEIVKKEKEKLAGWQAELEKFREQLKNL